MNQCEDLNTQYKSFYYYFLVILHLKNWSWPAYYHRMDFSDTYF